jgi:hypothetical protein
MFQTPISGSMFWIFVLFCLLSFFLLEFSLPARNPACQSFVRRAGAPAKAGVSNLGLIMEITPDFKFFYLPI